jgi:hypothetical protein
MKYLTQILENRKVLGITDMWEYVFGLLLTGFDILVNRLTASCKAGDPLYSPGNRIFVLGICILEYVCSREYMFVRLCVLGIYIFPFLEFPRK